MTISARRGGKLSSEHDRLMLTDGLVGKGILLVSSHKPMT